jgi:hypothetical protein
MKNILAYLRIGDPKISEEKHGDTRRGRKPRTNCTYPGSWRN